MGVDDGVGDNDGDGVAVGAFDVADDDGVHLNISPNLKNLSFLYITNAFILSV